MLRKVISLLLTAVMVLVLAACGKKGMSLDPVGHTEKRNYPAYEASDEFNAAEYRAASKEPWPEMVWKLNCGAGTSSSWMQAALYFNALMQESTEGKVSVTIRGDNGYSAGSETESIQMLMYGEEFQLSLESGLAYSLYDPRFSVTSLPYLFSNSEEADAVLGGSAGKRLKECLAGYGMYCLGIGENGFLQLTTSGRSVKSPNDLEGLTFCTGQNALREEVFRRLGAEALPVDMADAANAIRSGEAVGQEQSLAVLQSQTLPPTQHSINLWNASYDCIYFCMNQNVYSQLTDEQKKVVNANAVKAMTYQKSINRRHAEAALEEWKSDSKLEVNTFDSIDTEAFRAALEGVEAWYQQELVSFTGMKEEEAAEYVAAFHPVEK